MKKIAFVVVLFSVFNVACTSIEYNPEGLENNMLENNNSQIQNNSDEDSNSDKDSFINPSDPNFDPALLNLTTVPFGKEVLEPITFK